VAANVFEKPAFSTSMAEVSFTRMWQVIQKQNHQPIRDRKGGDMIRSLFGPTGNARTGQHLLTDYCTGKKVKQIIMPCPATVHSFVPFRCE
jgi:hypothetical protein